MLSSSIFPYFKPQQLDVTLGVMLEHWIVVLEVLVQARKSFNALFANIKLKTKPFLKNPVQY